MVLCRIPGTEESTCLRQLEEMDIFSKRDFINEVSTLASVQQSLSQTMDKITDVWETRELLVKPFDEDPNAFILGITNCGSQSKKGTVRQGVAWPSIDFRIVSLIWHYCSSCSGAGDISELLSIVEDHQISVQRMLHNPYVGVLKEKVELWAGKLDVAQQVLGKESLTLIGASSFVTCGFESESD